MAKNKVLKMAIDIVMTVLMILLMGYSSTGYFVHEVLGITIFVLFVFHCILNFRWFKQLPNQLKRVSLFSVPMIWTFVNLLLVIDIIGLMLSSLLMSSEILDFIQTTDKAPWIFMHKITAYTAFILISIHLGLHWNMIMQMGRKIFSIKDKNKIRTVFLRMIALLMAVLGVKSSFERSIALKYLPDTTAAASMKGNHNTEKSKKQSGKKEERGRHQGEQAVEYYNTQVTTSVDTTLNHDIPSETDEGFKNDFTIQVDRDSILKVFGDYIPIMGLYIAGTYYTLQFKKKKNQKKYEEGIV